MDLQDTVQLLHTFKEIGLSAREANVYLKMLNLGANAASVIAKHAYIHRSCCYTVLNNLLQKGFIEKIIKNKVTYFSPIKPELILQKLTNKKRELDTEISSLIETIQNFEKFKSTGEKPCVSFFEDAAGIQNIMEETLTSKEVLRMHASLSELTVVLPRYFPDYVQRRTNLKISVKAIYPADDYSYSQKLQGNDKTTETRLIPPEFDFHLAIIIFENKVAIISLREKFGLVIKSAQMAESQKKMFDLFWDVSGKYDPIMTELMRQKKPPCT